MSDLGDTFRDFKAFQRLLKARYGVACPECRRLQPRRDPTIILPGQRCRVDGYRDPRPHLTDEQEQAVWRDTP